jgi:hypothetical protein
VSDSGDITLNSNLSGYKALDLNFINKDGGVIIKAGGSVVIGDVTGPFTVASNLMYLGGTGNISSSGGGGPPLAEAGLDPGIYGKYGILIEAGESLIFTGSSYIDLGGHQSGLIQSPTVIMGGGGTLDSNDAGPGYSLDYSSPLLKIKLFLNL